MRIWTASAVIRYYLDPAIDFLSVRERGNGRKVTKGYYIIPHCDPGCCRDFGGISRADLGPFATRLKARNWSRRYMAGPGNSAH